MLAEPAVARRRHRQLDRPAGGRPGRSRRARAAGPATQAIADYLGLTAAPDPHRPAERPDARADRDRPGQDGRRARGGDRRRREDAPRRGRRGRQADRGAGDDDARRPPVARRRHGQLDRAAGGRPAAAPAAAARRGSSVRASRSGPRGERGRDASPRPPCAAVAFATGRRLGYRRCGGCGSVGPPAGVDAGTCRERAARRGDGASRERRSSGAVSGSGSMSDLRSEGASPCAHTSSPDLTVLRSEVAARLGLADTRRATPRSSRSAATTSPTSAGPAASSARAAARARACSGSTSRSKWHCYACRYQFSVTAGTLFHSSHLPVWKWFVAVHLMLDVARRPLGQRASADDRRQLQDRLVRGAPHPRRDARARRRAAPQTSSTPSCARPAPPRRPSRPSSTARERHRARAHAAARRRPAPPAERQVPAGLHRRAALARRRTSSNPHVFRDTIQALLEGEGISYDRLVAAV